MENNMLYNKLIERVVAERPELAPFAELFQQISTTDSKETGKSNKEAVQRYKQLLYSAKVLKEDFDDLLDEQEDLAKALGACTICWGEDDRCEKCRGRGQSGFFKPDERLFSILILPALKRITWLEIKEVK